jgi:hypothetical protein
MTEEIKSHKRNTDRCEEREKHEGIDCAEIDIEYYEDDIDVKISYE